MPLFRRRPLLRAAAVGGGAYMAGKHRANAEAEQQETAYAEGQQSMASAPPAQAPGTSSDDIARLQQLGQLHDQGVLTDEEFTRQKTLILAG